MQLCRVALLFTLLCATSLAAQSIANGPPPLLPGEHIVKTRNGCSIILELGAAEGAEKAKFADEYSKEDWSGQCLEGLVHGWGTLSRHLAQGMPLGTGERYFLGRAERIQSGPALYGEGRDFTFFDEKTGRFAFVKDKKDPFAPVWTSKVMGGTSLRDPQDGTEWSTQQDSCILESERFKDCDVMRPYDVFSVRHSGGEGGPKTFWCPNPKSSAGCEALWREKTAPAVERIQQLMAKVKKQDAEARANLSALMAPWLRARLDARVAAALAGVRKDAEASAQRKGAKTAADSANATARDKADSAFTASLAKLNAGQLFAQADAKRLEGDAEKARLAYRTLLSRFPDHALAAQAAQQLTALPAASAPAAAGATASSGGLSPMEALGSAMGARSAAP